MLLTNVSKEEQKTAIYGTKFDDSCVSLEAVSTKRLWRLYVGNIKLSTSVDQIRDNCVKAGLSDVKVEKLESKYYNAEKTKSAYMKIEVNYEHRML